MSRVSRAEARQRIVRRGRELLADGLTQRTSGNLSVRVDDEVVISPSGLPYDDIEPEDVPVVDLDGDVLDGERTPSSETPMHVRVYRERRDVGAVVHTHSPYATTFACVGRSIEPIHYLVAIAGSRVPVASYGRNATDELGRNAVDALGGEKAVLLRNHGVLAVGDDLADAYDVAARVEFCARMQYQATNLGDPEVLPPEEVNDLIGYFQ